MQLCTLKFTALHGKYFISSNIACSAMSLQQCNKSCQPDSVLRNATRKDTHRHRTALHCIALYCTALHCTTLHCAALHCVALYCTVLQVIPDNWYYKLFVIIIHSTLKYCIVGLLWDSIQTSRGVCFCKLQPVIFNRIICCKSFLESWRALCGHIYVCPHFLSQNFKLYASIGSIIIGWNNVQYYFYPTKWLCVFDF